MSDDLNEHAFPNGGWKFRQPQTGWSNPMAMVGFKASVDAIIKHRLANPAITAKHSLATDPYAVAEELKTFTRLRLGMPPPASSFFQWGRSPSRQDGAVAAAGSGFFRKITRVGTGITTLADWLGSDGTPVANTLAEQRAGICAGTDDKSKCPLNNKGDLLSIFTKPAADLIRRQIEEKKKMNLRTTKDSELGTCDACGCPLELKVHVPLKFIKTHMKEPEASQLDPRCWIKKEL